MKHRLILCGSRDRLCWLFNIVCSRSHLPILSLTMALAHFHLTFVLIAISKCHHCSFRRHRIVDEWAPVRASILEHHLAQSLKSIIIKLSDVENTICDIKVPVSTSATHLVVLEKSVVFVRSFEHTCTPTGALSLFKFSNIFNPEFLTFRNAALSFCFWFFDRHFDRLENIFKISMFCKFLLNLCTTLTGLCFSLSSLINPSFNGFKVVVASNSVSFIH